MDKPQVGKLLLVSSALFLAIGLVMLALGQPRVISLAMVGVAVGDLVAATVIRRLQ
jgi:dolichol kinase